MQSLYKVLIVEQSEQMVHIYKNMLPWEDYKFEVSSVTDNEVDALALYGEYKFDLVICDATISSGNGISLINKMKKIEPNCIVAVISDRDDYDTVREAFLAGAIDYLIKSKLRYSTLVNLLQRVSAKLSEGPNMYERMSILDQLEANLGLIRDGQNFNKPEIERLLSNLNYPVLNDEYYMLYFRQDHIRNFNRTMKQYDKPDWMNSDEFMDMFKNKISMRDEIQNQIRRIVLDIISDIDGAKLIFTKKHSGLVLLPLMDQSKYDEIGRKIIDTMNEKLTYHFSITQSRRTRGCEEFIESYIETIKEHERIKYYSDDCAMFKVEDAPVYYSLTRKYAKLQSLLVTGVLEQNFDKVQTSYREILNEMRINQINPGEVKLFFAGCINKIEERISENETIEEFPYQSLITGIAEAENLIYLEFELEHMFKTLIDWIAVQNIRQYSSNVNRIIEYLEANVENKISLNAISESLGLSPTHVSRLFKAETGGTIIDYANTLKMEKAKELLLTTDLKIKDIASQVGIADQLYFNKVFKKYYSDSPRDFRKKS